jgi:hypothetical protein
MIQHGDYGKMRYKCALLKILISVTTLSFNEFKNIKILFYGPKRVTERGISEMKFFFFYDTR